MALPPAPVTELAQLRVVRLVTFASDEGAALVEISTPGSCWRGSDAPHEDDLQPDEVDEVAACQGRPPDTVGRPSVCSEGPCMLPGFLCPAPVEGFARCRRMGWPSIVAWLLSASPGCARRISPAA